MFANVDLDDDINIVIKFGLDQLSQPIGLRIRHPISSSHLLNPLCIWLGVIRPQTG